ncbi:restriction endonuclease subunit S [Microcoleus sp. Pol17_C1]|uniref:restriction endonuclease subunit S n=1 Tax=unclassified Microcoleus TaxID=2642155 RepID=UPI002FD4CE47
MEDVTIDGSHGLKRGPFGGAIKKDSFVPDGYKIYEQKHAIYGDFDSGSYFITETRYRELKSFAVEPGDLIVSCSGTLGRVAVVPPTAKPGIINQALLRIRPKSNLVSSRFLKMLLETPDLQSRLFGSAGGSAIKNVKPLSEIRQVQFQLPSLHEQERIAEILDRAEELRSKRREAIAQLDSLTQAIFIEMFGDPVTNPKGIKVVRLSEITTRITDGVHQKPNYTENGVPFISVKNITTGSLKFEDCKFISLDDHLKFTKRCKAERLDILYTKVGATYGRPALVNTDCEFSIYVSVCLIKPDKKLIDPFFLNAALGTTAVKSQADRKIKGIGVPDLHLDQIQNFLIPLPSMKEQNEFAHRVEAVEKLKAAHRASLSELDALFASLQHRAFRGEL